jgi:signal transduction histidine kinase
MQIRDLSIKKRLLLSNFIMIIIPVLFMVTLSASVFLSFRFGNINRATILTFIWPESGPTLATQFELTRFRVRADDYHGSKHHLMESADHLEDLGYRVVILKPDHSYFYVTAGTDGREIMREVLAKSPEGRGSIIWGENGLAFHYISDESGLQLGVIGTAPLVVDGEYIDISSKDLFKSAFYIVCLIVTLLIIFIGWKLSRWLGRQIIQPLEVLQATASHIAQGDLDTPVPVESEDEIGMTMLAFELTRRQLKRARETREKYDRSRKELIAGISHDLSTPLTKIEGYAYGLQDRIANTPEKRAHYIHMIIETAENMEKLVRTLFLFSKLDLGQVEYHLEAVPLRAYLNDYVEDQKEHYRGKGLEIILEASCDEVEVNLDRLQFSRIISNILSNSIKYKTASIGHMVIRLMKSGDSRVRLIFEDDGPGVGEADLKHLFESFYRTDKARTNTSKGSGLGLAVVRELVKGMGGIIWAENAQPHGLIIAMEFPVKKGES